jgi:hypothetical protein
MTLIGGESYSGKKDDGLRAGVANAEPKFGVPTWI